MRMTIKRVRAEHTLSIKVRKHPGGMDNDRLYGELQKAGYVWDSKSSEWIEGKRASNGEPLSNSEFMTVSGQPSGVVKIRLMGHPSDLHLLANLIKEAMPRLTVISVSDEYPNRKGVGSRIYIDAMIR